MHLSSKVGKDHVLTNYMSTESAVLGSFVEGMMFLIVWSDFPRKRP